MATGADISERRVTVHMGVQKTASTALHHLLQRNAGRLAGRLVVRTPAPQTPTKATARAAIAYSLAPNDANRALLANHAATLRDELIATGDAPVLVSHENLCGAMPGNGGEVKLYPQIGRILQLLMQQLAPLKPRFAFYTRDMGRWKRSVHNQAVKTDGYAGTWEDFQAETACCGDWGDLRARVEAAVGAENAAFFRLEDEPDPMRPGRQLLAHAGLGEDEISALEPLTWRSNESLNAGALEFMRQVNRIGLAGQPRLKVMQIVMQNQALFAPGSAAAQDVSGGSEMTIGQGGPAARGNGPER